MLNLKLKLRRFFTSVSSLILLSILFIPLMTKGQIADVKRFAPDLIMADIDTLISQLMLIHPTFEAHYQTNHLDREIDRIKGDLKAPMSSLDIFRLLQPVVCIDGHTTLRHTEAISQGEEKPLFPFRVIIHNNALYVKKNYSDDQSLAKGTLIQRINGVETAEIINNLLRYVPGEKLAYKTKSLEAQFHIYLALVYGSFSQFSLMSNGSEITLGGTRWESFDEPAQPKFELRFYDDDIAYIYKQKFMPPADFLHFMDSAFAVISQKQIKYLIIDNLSGGGLTDLADSLMSYFAHQPYCMVEKKVTKISSMTQDFITGKMTEGTVKDGFFIQQYPVHHSGRQERFSGKTYILSGPLSYSAATCFPAAGKFYDTAIVVGQESGQSLVSNGDRGTFVLPKTGMICITALSTIYMPGGQQDLFNGVIPDHIVNPTLNDLLNDTNYVLEYTLEMIRASRSKH